MHTWGAWSIEQVGDKTGNRLGTAYEVSQLESTALNSAS